MFKYYLQQDSADSGPVLMHSHSRKKAKVTCDEIADQAVLRGDADAGAIEERSASGHAPSTTNSGLAQQPTTGMKELVNCTSVMRKPAYLFMT